AVMSAAPNPNIPTMSAVATHKGDAALGAGLAVSNFANRTLAGVNIAMGEEPFPTPDPENDRQWNAYEKTNNVLEVVNVSLAAAGFAKGLEPGVPPISEPADPFVQLRQARMALRLPEAGSAADNATVAKLEIGGRESM